MRGAVSEREEHTSGNVWQRAVLGEAAWAAISTKGSYPRAQYYRLARWRGKNNALMAVAHNILVCSVTSYMRSNPSKTSALITSARCRTG